MSFFGDLVSAVVRGGLAFYTGGLSEIAFGVVDNDNKAGNIGGAIGMAIGAGGGASVLGDGPQKTVTGTGTEKAVQKMQAATTAATTPASNTSALGKAFGWMKDNPELTKMIGSGLANMFTPDEIDIMRERAKLSSRNYKGGGIVDLPGRSGSFGQRADQESQIKGGYTEDSANSKQSIDPFVGAGDRPTVRAQMDQQRYKTNPQEYYDSMKKNRGLLTSRMRNY